MELPIEVLQSIACRLDPIDIALKLMPACKRTNSLFNEKFQAGVQFWLSYLQHVCGNLSWLNGNSIANACWTHGSRNLAQLARWYVIYRQFVALLMSSLGLNFTINRLSSA